MFHMDQSSKASDFDISDLKAKTLQFAMGFVHGYRNIDGLATNTSQELARLYSQGHSEGKQFAHEMGYSNRPETTVESSPLLKKLLNSAEPAKPLPSLMEYIYQSLKI